MMIFKFAFLALGIVVTALTVQPSHNAARSTAGSETVGSLTLIASVNS